MRSLVVAALVLSTPLVSARQPSFTSGTELVRIPLSVTRGDQVVEPGVLTAADFKVSENGVEQRASLFQREALPLSLCVVFDTSPSMGGKVGDAAVATLRRILNGLLPEDEVAIVAFDKVPTLALPWTRGSAIRSIPINLEGQDGTAIVDAMLSALAMMNSARNPRPVILLITDGGDNSSKLSASDVATTRRQSETQVYAVSVAPETRIGPTVIDDPPPPSMPRPMMTGGSSVVLPRLIGDSGGVEYRVRVANDAVAVARTFLDDLRFQYTLGYHPLAAFDGKYRRVKVEVRQRGYRVRHRGGYLALPSGEPR
jgi:Ca-activated chloride channel family protein